MPLDIFPFLRGDVRAKDILSVFDISRRDRAIYYHVGTRHVGKVLIQQLTHESQGALRGLSPLVLSTGETFAILCHHVDEHNGAVHGVMIIEAIRKHVEDDPPTRQQHSEAISGFTVKNDPVLPGGTGQGEYVCDRLWIVPYPPVSVEVGSVPHLT